MCKARLLKALETIRLVDKKSGGWLAREIEQIASIIQQLPEHTATATTPNPPLTADECLGKEVWAYDSTIPRLLPTLHRHDATASDYHSLLIRLGSGLCYYAHDPALHPPTPREEG